MKKGCPYGTHRVIEPKGVLPQPALKISNDMEIYDNEILIDVQTLNIDSASFTQIKEEANGDLEKIKEIMLNIVETKGKHQNPVTGSGGMLIGTVFGVFVIPVLFVIFQSLQERISGKPFEEKESDVILLNEEYEE